MSVNLEEVHVTEICNSRTAVATATATAVPASPAT
jgi:hypothetical protein